MPSPVSWTASSSHAGSRRASTRTVPSAGVWRTAFTSRFWSTRASRGEHVAPADPLQVGDEREPLLLGGHLDGRRRRSARSRSSRARRGLGLDRSGVELCQLEQVVDHRDELVHRSGASRRRSGAGSRGSSTTPSSIASTIARRVARGVRRSWETVVIRSRRVASARRSRSCAASRRGGHVVERPCERVELGSGVERRRPGCRGRRRRVARPPREPVDRRGEERATTRAAPDAGPHGVQQQRAHEGRVVLGRRTSSCDSTTRFASATTAPTTPTATNRWRIEARASSATRDRHGDRGHDQRREHVGREVQRCRRSPMPIAAPTRNVPAAPMAAHRDEERRRARRSWLEPVPDAPHRDQVRGVGGIVLDLLAEAAHVDGHGVRVAVPREVPDVFEQLRCA